MWFLSKPGASTSKILDSVPKKSATRRITFRISCELHPEQMAFDQERTANWQLAGRINIDELRKLMRVPLGGDARKIDFLAPGKVLMYGGARC